MNDMLEVVSFWIMVTLTLLSLTTAGVWVYLERRPRKPLRQTLWGNSLDGRIVWEYPHPDSNSSHTPDRELTQAIIEWDIRQMKWRGVDRGFPGSSTFPSGRGGEGETIV